MKKVSLSFIVDNLTELGWDYSCGRMYTNNETALLTLISNINNQFYYVGEEDDKVAPVDVKKFTQYCVDFIDSLEIEK